MREEKKSRKSSPGEEEEPRKVMAQRAGKRKEKLGEWKQSKGAEEV